MGALVNLKLNGAILVLSFYMKTYKVCGCAQCVVLKTLLKTTSSQPNKLNMLGYVKRKTTCLINRIGGRLPQSGASSASPSTIEVFSYQFFSCSKRNRIGVASTKVWEALRKPFRAGTNGTK